MTELQYGLIGLGGLAVAGVVAYNMWQERAHRRVAEQVLKKDHDDVLLGGKAKAEQREEPKLRPSAAEAEERREPVLSDTLDDEPDWQAPVVASREEATAPAVLDDAPVAVAEAPEEDIPPPDLPTRILDPRLDFIVAMEMVEAVSAGQILHSQREALQRLAKPVVWAGFNERSRAWEKLAPEADVAYRSLRIGLQLADRRGPLAEADLNIFVAAMQNLADEMLAVLDMPSELRVLEKAYELDRFCADVDLEIGVNLVSRGMAFSGTKVRALAEAAGMVLGGGGLFIRYDDDGNALFSLQNLETAPFSPESIKNVATHGLTFLLDVPRVDHGDRVFVQMVDLARRFGETLQGALVDDNRQPLSDAQLDQIRREFVLKPQANMAQFGLPAGGPQALRLFA